MFKKIAAEALGLSDVGKIIPPEDYDKVDSDDYIFHEENEKIFFLIKSKKDEYCFTNKGLIHLDGDSAVSSKRMLKRYDYRTHRISGVRLETAGTIDLDVEIKFVIGDESFSIDVHKSQLEGVKDLYKALYKIGSIQSKGEYRHSLKLKTLEITEKSLPNKQEQISKEDFVALSDSVYSWLKSSYDNNNKEDYAKVFELYIKG